MELFPKLTAEKSGMPPLPPVIPEALETFAGLTFDDLWPEAHMTQVAHYLRSGIHLKIPSEFLPLLPRRL